MSASDIIMVWPESAREAAQLVIDRYGEPDEVCESQLTWFDAGPWKRVNASRTFYEHNFPAPHVDSVQSFIDYRVPTMFYSAIAEFDGSLIVERTAGEVSARCHNLEANTLALNLMHDMITGQRTIDEAREYCRQAFVDARHNRPTPYMDQLRFVPGDGTAGDPDVRVLNDADLKQ